MSLAKTPDITSAGAARAVSSRRTLFGGAAAVVIGSGITAGAAASVADLVPIDADAELIGVCSRYRVVRDAVNSDCRITDADPRWRSYFDLCDKITDWHLTTVEGLIAKARVTKEDARHPDGSEELEAQSMQWAWDVLNGLIALGERA